MSTNSTSRVFDRKLILTVIVIIAGIIIAVSQPFAGLDKTGHIMLGTVVAALATWIFQPAAGSFTVGGVILLLGGSLAGLPMADLASGFSSPSLWLLIPAMFLGYALLKTGLGKRIVYMLFKRLNLSYPKILIGWLVVGLLFSVLTPSITVRFLILTPIAVSVADACRLENRSKGRSLIIISAWVVSIFPGTAWKTGSLYGPVFSSYLPEGAMQAMATDADWVRVMALPWLLMAVLFLVCLYFVLKPEKKLEVTKAQISDMYLELGVVSSEEKRTIGAFCVLLAGLVLQNFIAITTNQVLLVSFAVLLLLGVLSTKEISTGINWDIVVFFGIILSFSRIFEVSGITAWLSPMLSAMLEPFASSALLFIIALYVICVLLRFLDVAQGWIISAIIAMAAPNLYESFGIHPLVLIMVFICASNLFFFRYHQPWVGQVEAVCGERGWDSKHLAKASVLYAVLAAVILVVSFVYWRIIGII